MQINKGLTKIEYEDIIKRSIRMANEEQRKEMCKYKWQELALEIIKGLEDGDQNKGSIFKYCKQNETYARKCYLECQELNKLHSRYFFKIFTKKL